MLEIWKDILLFGLLSLDTEMYTSIVVGDEFIVSSWISGKVDRVEDISLHIYIPQFCYKVNH